MKYLPDNRNDWLLAGGFALMSAVLYKSGLLMFFYLVPLQIVFARRGLKDMITTGSFTLVILFVVLIFEIFAYKLESHPVLLLIELIVPAVYIAGLIWVNYKNRFTMYERVWIASLIATAIGVLVFAYLRQTTDGSNGFEESLLMIMRTVADSTASPETMYDLEMVLELLKDVLLSTIVAGYSIQLLFSWYIGSRLGTRRMGPRKPLPLKKFKVKPEYIWLVIVFLAGTLGGSLLEHRFVMYACINGLIVTAMIFGVQGYGILYYWGENAGMTPRNMRMLSVVVIFFFFIPGLNVVLLVGLPALGIAETWIAFRPELKEQ